MATSPSSFHNKNRRRGNPLKGLLALALAAVAPLAHADNPTPNASGSVEVVIRSDQTGDAVLNRKVAWSPASQAGLSFDQSGIRGSASISADPQPTLSVELHAYGMPENTGVVTSRFTYFLGLGGSQDALVPVHMLGATRGQATIYGEYFALLRVFRESTGELLYQFHQNSFRTDGEAPSFSAVLAPQLSFTRGERYRVTMQIDVTGSQADNSSGPVDALASVFLDPAFMIDPAFALANPGYNLFVSADVGNPPFEVSAVPEPGGALMLVLGLGVVAWARRVSPAAA